MTMNLKELGLICLACVTACSSWAVLLTWVWGHGEGRKRWFDWSPGNGLFDDGWSFSSFAHQVFGPGGSGAESLVADQGVGVPEADGMGVAGADGVQSLLAGVV